MEAHFVGFRLPTYPLRNGILQHLGVVVRLLAVALWMVSSLTFSDFVFSFVMLLSPTLPWGQSPAQEINPSLSRYLIQS